MPQLQLSFLWLGENKDPRSHKSGLLWIYCMIFRCWQIIVFYFKDWFLKYVANTDTGTDWAQEEKGATENKMVGSHYRPHGHEFEQIPGDGEGNGTPLQYSCLERDRKAWWAAVSGVAQSWTRLKRLSSSSEGQGNLVCCNPWGLKEFNMT